MMKRKILRPGRRWRAALVAAVAIGAGMAATASCEMFEAHPYDAHVTGPTGLTARYTQRIEEATRGKDTLRIAMISDTQRSYDETEAAVKAINRRGDVDFVVHGGDQADFGVTQEFEDMRRRLERLHMPYVCVIGNHDCLGTGREVYRRIYGPVNFAFTAAGVRFVCLNTNALEYDYSEPVPDFGFLEGELALAAAPGAPERTVVVMHAPPGSEVFNNNVARVFEGYVRRLRGVVFCLYGHTHHLSVKDLFGDGVLYYECPNVARRIYLLFTLYARGGYDYEVVHF